MTPFNDAMRMPNASMLSGHGLPSLAMLEGIITQQAAAMAYSNDFLFMTLISLCAFPLLALIRSPKRSPSRGPGPEREQAAHAVIVAFFLVLELSSSSFFSLFRCRDFFFA